MSKRERPRLLNFDGADADFIYFSTESWTRPGSGIDHTVAISKRDGFISCTCEDAICRHKTDRVNAEKPRLCKHGRAVIKWANQLLEALGESPLANIGS